ncbi:hypothetical protein M0R04_05895 [Candidatus Dojkabacteria bacterium]|jgi:hypothetical protein|nr:hypothetical protein [Candidatus Dojkabacteria bacterium]
MYNSRFSIYCILTNNEIIVEEFVDTTNRDGMFANIVSHIHEGRRCVQIDGCTIVVNNICRLSKAAKKYERIA